MLTRTLLGLFFSTISFALAADPAEVSISLDTSGPDPIVVVSPQTVEIKLGDRVRFVSSGDHEAKIEIEFAGDNDAPGPFPIKKNAKDVIRGLFKTPVGNPIITLGADTKGEFKYSVKWTTGDGTQYDLDPGIIVR